MKLEFPKIEKKILKFWKENKIFEKSIEQRKRARNFVFYEGPPTANAKAGLHHVLARVYKDIICRYKTMRGFRVLRKAGWDTHGLPVELEIEKKLGLKSKKDIEKYGMAEFNKKCKESVWEYKKDWEKLTERIAFWLDMEHPYITYENDYIETLWWIIKQIYQKGLLYQDYKVVPYCPRCGTSLSSHEVALGYKKIREPAIYVKFKLKAQNLKLKTTTKNSKLNNYLLIWTTTPWTLPGNVAVAVNPEFIYAKVKVGAEFLILAKERLNILDKDYTVVEEFKGKDLLGLEYEPLYLFYDHQKKYDKKAWFVVRGDFVSLEEGTGLVHIAPAFGEEDLEVGRENNLPILVNVDEEGKFKMDVRNWAGLYVKNADLGIIQDLKNRNLLWKEELYEHDYPFCWRCDNPLLYYAKTSWFIRMTEIKKDLIKNNQKINWIPAYLKQGRFGEWLREVKDWALTRERYWGTPFPVWRCQSCDNIVVIGSKEDLLKQKFSTNQYYFLRHGESLFQTKYKKIFCGWPEKVHCPLTKRGIEQIKKVAEDLAKEKIDLIYSSDFLRTRQTAEIVAKKLGLKINLDSRLRDMNWGVYNGKPREELYRAFPDLMERFTKRPPKGESWNDKKLTMLKFINDLEKKHQGKKILIVSHGDPLWLLEGGLKGLTNQELIKQKLEDKTNKVGEIRKVKFTRLPLNKAGEPDFHRPYIDQVKFFCPKCDTLMEREPEVIDCWFDSGSMPFAQYHYPFENKNLIDKKIQFPADFISEGVDQTRGWFYTLHAISTLVKKSHAYKNVISLGHILDEKGEKMSKSKGNVVDPELIIEKYGADVLRWYFYTVNQPGDAKLFKERNVLDCLKRFIMIFWNCYQFYKTYVTRFFQLEKSRYILNRWVISRLNELIVEVTEKLDRYDVTGAARAIENFVVEDFSQWYIRRSRKRIKEAAPTLSFVLQTLSKLTAPFIPFLSEEIYRGVIPTNLSVHLEDWPKANKKLIDKKLKQKMERVRKIVTAGLAVRVREGIKVRQPLASLKTKTKISKIKKENKEFLNLIKEELNVKKVLVDPKIKEDIELDTKITPELKEEGQIREVIRHIQEMRKKAGLKPKDKISVQYFGTPELNKILEKNKSFILKETKAKDFSQSKRPVGKEINIDQQKLWLRIKKL